MKNYRKTLTMNKGLFLTARDHETLVNMINDFYDVPELKMMVENAIEAHRQGKLDPNENVDVYNVNELFDFYMCMCGFGSIADGIVDDELDQLFGNVKTPRINRKKQERLIAKLQSEGLKTYILGNNVLAFSINQNLDHELRYFVMWRLVKYIGDGRREEARIADYYSDPEWENRIVINGRVFHVPDRLDPGETSAFVSSEYHARQRAEADIGDIELPSRFMIPMPSHIIYKKANKTILGYKDDYYVLKVTRCDSEEQFERAVTERNCMEALSSCSDVSLKVRDSMVDEEHKTVYIKMEKARTLKEALSKGKLQLSDALKSAGSICDALITLRDKLGIYHNDISLSNCYYKKGKVKLGDFDNAIPVNVSLNHIAGTVKYMAPETYNSHIHDERSEIYSVMMLIYVLLNQGHAAFEQELGYDAATETRMQGARELPVPAELGTVPEALKEAVRALLKRGCAHDPDERFQTFEDMREQSRSLLMYVFEHGEDKYNFRLNSSNYNPSEATTEILTERF